MTNVSSETATRIRLYLDGLDEIASAERRQEVIQLARSGSKDHPNCQIVLTSRDYVYQERIDWAPKIYLSEFEDGEVLEFRDRWLGEESEVNRQFREQLRNMPSLYHLLRTPLLATLVCMVFRQTGRLPESKVRLYEMFVDLLSGGWDLAKGVLRGSKYGQRIKVIVLSSLAGNLHTMRRREFTDADLKKAIQSSLLGLTLADWETLREELIGDGIIGQSGGVMYFSHLSFQEFLAAKTFMGSPHPTRSQKALEFYLEGDDWWREVLRFYISLSSNPEVVSNWLLHQFERLISRYHKGVTVPRALDLLGSIVESFPEFPIEELAAKMGGILGHNQTLEYLKDLKQRIYQP